MSRELDQEFLLDAQALEHAVALMGQAFVSGDAAPLSASLPETGRGSLATLDQLAPLVLGQAARLGSPVAFAHKDPPTPWITWATTLWNASLNQNLLHPATAPVARELEEKCFVDQGFQSVRVILVVLEMGVRHERQPLVGKSVHSSCAFPTMLIDRVDCSWLLDFRMAAADNWDVDRYRGRCSSCSDGSDDGGGKHTSQGNLFNFSFTRYL